MDTFSIEIGESMLSVLESERAGDCFNQQNTAEVTLSHSEGGFKSHAIPFCFPGNAHLRKINCYIKSSTALRSTSLQRTHVSGLIKNLHL